MLFGRICRAFDFRAQPSIGFYKPLFGDNEVEAVTSTYEHFGFSPMFQRVSAYVCECQSIKFTLLLSNSLLHELDVIPV